MRGEDAEGEDDGGEGDEGPLDVGGVAGLGEGRDEGRRHGAPEHRGVDAGAEQVEGVAVEGEGADVEEEDEGLVDAEDGEGAVGGDVRLGVDHEGGGDADDGPEGLDAARGGVGGDLGDGADLEGEEAGDEREEDEDGDEQEGEEGHGDLLAAPRRARGIIPAEPDAQGVRVGVALDLAVDGEQHPSDDGYEKCGHLQDIVISQESAALSPRTKSSPTQ